jgi:arylsulfatase
MNAARLVLLVTAVFSASIGHGQPNIGKPAEPRPNIILIMSDDIGYSDIGCFGSEIDTPNLDQLGRGGLRFTQFSNMAKCNPTRSSMLNGLMVPVPIVSKKATTHTWAENSIHMAELFKKSGYYTAMSGKEHYDQWVPKRCYASNRIFDDYFTYWAINPFFERGDGKPFEYPFILNGKEVGVDQMIPHRKPFFKTDVVTDYALRFMSKAAEQNKPFFLYLPYHAAHYPLQARPEDISKYRGKYKELGWEKVRKQRFKKQQKLGILPQDTSLPTSDLEWNKLSDKEKDEQDLLMSVFSGLVSRMDENIGRVIDQLRASNCLENTLIVYLSDNGSTETLTCPNQKNRTPQPPGPHGGASSYSFLGEGWAKVGNTPFRKYKTSSFAGGARTHALLSFPAMVQPAICAAPVHVTDLYPTFLEVAGIPYPKYSGKRNTPSLDGVSLVPLMKGESLVGSEERILVAGTWQQTQSIRSGDWKLITGQRVKGKVREGKYLFNLKEDPTEMNNLAQVKPEKVRELESKYAKWLSDKQKTTDRKKSGQ